MFRSKEEQFDFYWKEIFDGLAYNPIEFNTYRFDQAMSLPGKVNKLYDMFKVLAMNNQEVMDYLKEFVETFDFKLETTIEDILQVWLDDGLLADVIREAINEEVIEARTDYLGETYESLGVRLNSELLLLNNTIESYNKTKKSVSELYANVKDYGAKGDGVTDDTIAIQQALNENDSVYVPEGVFVVSQLTLKTNNILKGYNKLTSIIKQQDNTGNKALIGVPSGVGNTEISDLTIEGIEKYVGGMGIVHGVGASSSTPTNRHRLNRIYVKNFNRGVYINWYCVGLVANDVTCEFCGDGFTLMGTDATLTNILTAVMQRDGLRVEGDTNKISNCKSYYCGLSGTLGAGLKIVGCNFTSFTNMDIQENVLDGIFIQNSNHLLISGVIDGSGIRYNETKSVEYTDASGKCPISCLQIVRSNNLTMNLVIFSGRQTSTANWQSKYGICINQQSLVKNNVINVQYRDDSLPEVNAKPFGFRWDYGSPVEEKQSFVDNNKITFSGKELDPTTIDVYLPYYG